MASKRMFDKAIIDTDRFMDLPISGKALYFLLGMEADDEGFVSPKKVQRIHGGNDDDIKILVAKNFVIPFDSGIVVITDWNTNNYLNSTRVKPTQYQEEKSQLTLMPIEEKGYFTNDKKYVLNTRLTNVKPEEKRIEENRRDIAPKNGALEMPFDWKKYLDGMFESDRGDLNVIALYFKEKKIKFDTADEASAAIKRHLRSAKEVSKFGDEKIIKAMKKTKEEYPQIFTIETVLKMLTR